jgi:hypothetical protein
MDRIRLALAGGDGQLLRFRDLPIRRSPGSAQVSERVPRLNEDQATPVIISQADVCRTRGVGRARGHLEAPVEPCLRREAQDQFLDGEVAGIRRLGDRAAAEADFEIAA